MQLTSYTDYAFRTLIALASVAPDPEQLSLGAVARGMEAELGPVACLRTGDVPCVITAVCGLKPILREAMDQFLAVLDQQTLADVVTSKGRVAKLLRLGTGLGKA